MNILYFGEDKVSSTAYHRATAIQRLGHSVEIINPYKQVEASFNSAIMGKIHYRTGYFLLQRQLRKWLKKMVTEIKTPDVIWVNGGELFGLECIRILKSVGKPVVLYNNDDPTGGRDGNRFASLLKAIRYYDLCLVLRVPNIEEYKKLGAKNVLRVNMSYDEVIQKPFDDINEIPEKFRSDIAFIGTWMRNESRDVFLLHLIQKGLPVSIWGDHWQKSALWEKIKPHYRGKAISGRDYVAGIQGAKICIGMLSKGNRDLHTRRSVEVPFIGSVLCGERTAEHTDMFKEGEEAVFWDNADECAEWCSQLLADDVKREHIRKAGMEKVRALEVGNEDIARKALKTLFES